MVRKAGTIHWKSASNFLSIFYATNLAKKVTIIADRDRQGQVTTQFPRYVKKVISPGPGMPIHVWADIFFLRYPYGSRDVPHAAILSQP